MNLNMTEPACESRGTLADEPWETDAARYTVLRLSLERPIHHKPMEWRGGAESGAKGSRFSVSSERPPLGWLL